jgi:Leucine-rich repeat (LRR) protein
MYYLIGRISNNYIFWEDENFEKLDVHINQFENLNGLKKIIKPKHSQILGGEIIEKNAKFTDLISAEVVEEKQKLDKYINKLYGIKYLSYTGVGDNRNPYNFGKHFKYFKNLKKLRLTGGAYKIDPSDFGYLKNLESLSCGPPGINVLFKSSFNYLSNLKNLEINCEANNNKKEPLDDSIFKLLGNLERLVINDSKKIKGDTFNYLENLRILSISFCDNINDNNVKKLKNLKYLEVEECENIEINFECLGMFTKIKKF